MPMHPINQGPLPREQDVLESRGGVSRSYALGCYVNLLLLCFDDLLNSLYFIARFWRHQTFVFITLQTLLQKHRGWGYLTPKPRLRESRSSIGVLTMVINHWISTVTRGTNIDAPYHLC